MTQATVRAKSKETDTGIDLERGRSYEFSSSGIWVDWFVPCTASGYKGFWYMRRLRPRLRMPSARWFSLVGRISGSEELIDIGSHIDLGTSYCPDKAGRLLCFPNDLPGMYWNNWGAISLSVKAC